MRVLPWHQEVLAGIYDPTPRPRQGLVSIAKKNSKSTFAAALSIYHLVGDEEESAEVLLGSSDTDTAMIVWNMARRMIELEPRLSGILQIFKDHIYHPASDSILTTLSGDPKHSQGRGPSFAVVDEVYLTDPDLWDNLALGMAARRRPVLLGISTQGPELDEANLMTRLTAYGRAGGDPAFYFREWTAPPKCDVRDRSAWVASNPALGVTVTEAHLEALVRTTRENRFRAYHLNQAVAQDGAWMPLGAWAACAEPHGIPDLSEVVLTLDGSYNGDTTALLATTVSPRPHMDVAGLWQPSRGDPVDVLAVEDRIRECCRRWRVREVAADPFRWLRSLQLLAAEGIPVVEFPQSPARMSPATTGLYEAVVNRQVTHSGNCDLALHVAHAVIKEDARGTRVAKPSKDSPKRIDLAVCGIMGHARAQYWASQKAVRRRVAAF
jgi:phage terminase large subunit-like protein